MTTGMVSDHKLEKQIGCMSGFLQIFDRHQLKRINSAKRLPHSPLPAPEPEKCTDSPARGKQSPTPETTQAKMPLPSLSSFEFKEGTRSSWKFSREVPRLSLDSRAFADAKESLHRREIRTNPPMPSANPGDGAESDGDKHWRSTGVIARLMGLEPLQDSDCEPLKKAELLRSASESGVFGDFRSLESKNLQLKQPQSKTLGNISSNVVLGDAATSAIDNHLSNGIATDLVSNGKTECAKDPTRRRRIGKNKFFYDSADFFPEPKQHNYFIYGERLKMRGIDEPSKDLETLKQILEALQLKGLLHSKKSTTPINRRNFVSMNESPIVVMKPMRSSGSLNRIGRTGSPRMHSNNESLPSASTRLDLPEIDRNLGTQSQSRARNLSSPTRSDSSVRSPNRMRKLMETETQTKVNDGDCRRVPLVHSPKKMSSRRNTREQEQQLTGASARMRKATSSKEKVIGGLKDESSTIPGCSFSTSQTDTDRCKKEEYKEGRNLLKRCAKLLNNIAEITAATELSPVSVLDSSLYKDGSSCSSSPVMKRCIEYKGQPAELDDIWNAALCCSEAKSEEAYEDSDFAYVSEILRARNYLQEEDSDLFGLLEKQQCLKGNDTSKVSTLRRRLIFDTVHEILNRNQRLPPWKAASWVAELPLLQRIWSEFRRIREREEPEDLFEVIFGVLRKDMMEDGMNEWGECPIEVGDVVLDMERLIFKDLIGETIGDLASFVGKCN